MDRLGYLKELVNTKVFAKVRCAIVQEAMDKWQLHWSARHALHVWDKLDLSRSQFDNLRYLLSFIFNPQTSKYEPIKVWEDPDDPKSFVVSAQLASRWPRERLYHEICDAAGIIVSSQTGRCERDAVKLVSDMYSNFQCAMRDEFTLDRPAQPFLYVDGTGGSLGKGIGHAELGSADFANGVKQSRATLSPLALFEGNGHAESLRENMPLVAKSYNTLIKTEVIERHDGSKIPCRAGAAADMQAVKALAAQQERSHSPGVSAQLRPSISVALLTYG